MPGKLGHFFIIVALVSSLVSLVAYANALRKKDEDRSWLSLGRLSFVLHSLSVFSVFAILFYLIFNHRYEYHYVWSHSNNELPFKYLLSCFWEGQQGSFLLWLIWHSVLGLIVIKTARKWESGAMVTFTFVQFFLTATILGIYFFGYRIGSSPFELLRNVMHGAPIFQQENYLEFVKNGNGLNPLLQNYWMVIHPPILFLGFALTLVPFAYSIAALLKKDYTDWVKPVLVWSVLGVSILGLGIMMGGAWAYESLNFGGYWAWDPVENASLVPWLILVAGLHTLLIYKSTGFSLKTSIVFLQLTFFLIIYSTFLTRTGILGDTSVHSFTGEGGTLFEHLVIMLIAVALFASIIYQRVRKTIPAPKKEEATATREFWMFVGSLILLLSAIQITFTTSIPVWNKLFGLKLAPPENPMTHYNKVQVWIGILLALGSAFVQFLKYKNTNVKSFLKQQASILIVSILLCAAFCWSQNVDMWLPVLFVFTSVYAVCANFVFLAQFNKFNVLKAGASIAHIGFGLLLLGILISSFNKRVLSVNTLGITFDLGKGSDKENQLESRENKILFKNTPVSIDRYVVTYKGDSIQAPNHYYKLNFRRYDSASKRLLEDFYLYPNAQINPKMGLVSSPDTKRYWNRDIFTYITSTLDKGKLVDTFSYINKEVRPGDSIFLDNNYMVYEGLQTKFSNNNYKPAPNDVAVSAKVSVYDVDHKIKELSPVYLIRDMQSFQVEDSLKDISLNLKIDQINVNKKDGTITLAYKQIPADRDYVTIKVLGFPFINILLIGAILTTIGSLLAFYNRVRSK